MTNEEISEAKRYLVYVILKHPNYFKIKDDGSLIISTSFFYDDEEDDDDDKRKITITTRTKKIVCPECEGTGTELKGGLKGLAFTQSDRDEMDWEDFSQNILDGNYDVPCCKCSGRNVVDAPDLTHVKTDDLKELINHFNELEDQASADYWESEGERRMGA